MITVSSCDCIECSKDKLENHCGEKVIASNRFSKDKVALYFLDKSTPKLVGVIVTNAEYGYYQIDMIIECTKVVVRTDTVNTKEETSFEVIFVDKDVNEKDTTQKTTPK